MKRYLVSGIVVATLIAVAGINFNACKKDIDGYAAVDCIVFNSNAACFFNP